MGSFVFMFAAFSATWFVLFVYLFIIWRKQDRIEKGLQRLEEQIRS